MATVENLGQTYIVDATAEHTHSVIFFHGLGDTGMGWFDTMKLLSKHGFPHVKFICPTAPTLPVTLNFGMSMPAWFDILSLQKDGPVDKDGINKAKLIVEHFIGEEVKGGIPASKIVVGGFSQGGAISLNGALQTSHGQLAGVIGLSAFLPLAEALKENSTPENKKTPVLMGHGNADPVVNYAFGVASSDHLKSEGFSVDFRTYPGTGHTVSPQEIDDVRLFLEKLIGQ